MLFYKSITKIFELTIKTFFKVEIRGIENIPKEGSYILACNHKSNWDGIILAGLLRERKINGVAKKELFKNPIMKYILTKLFVMPIDRDKPELSTIKKILKLLKNKEIVAIFPEGTRHKDLNSFAEVKPGVGMFALKGKTSVLPVSLISNYKLFSKVILVIDKPICFDEYYNKKVTLEDYNEVSNTIINVIKQNYFNAKNN